MADLFSADERDGLEAVDIRLYQIALLEGLDGNVAAIGKYLGIFFETRNGGG